MQLPEHRSTDGQQTVTSEAEQSLVVIWIHIHHLIYVKTQCHEINIEIDQLKCILTSSLVSHAPRWTVFKVRFGMF